MLAVPPQTSCVFISLLLFTHLLFHEFYAGLIKYNLCIMFADLSHKMLLVSYYVHNRVVLEFSFSSCSIRTIVNSNAILIYFTLIMCFNYSISLFGFFKEQLILIRQAFMFSSFRSRLEVKLDSSEMNLCHSQLGLLFHTLDRRRT
jgi:hypothetical protein